MPTNASATATKAIRKSPYNRCVPAGVTPELSVIIPCFNERARLRRTIDDIRAWAAARGRTVEILVADDGSTDGTPDVARQWAADVPDLRVVALPSNQGKGSAVRAGMMAARAGLRAFVDADRAVPF